MSELGKIIPLSNDEKELYSKLDFKYFLDQYMKKENINPENVKLIEKGYSDTKKIIEAASDENKAQFHLFIEGYVRKMHSGGMLGSHFNLSEAREFKIFRFEDYGENWAYFEAWAKREKHLRFRKLVWKRLVEIGAVLGIVLSVIKLVEVIKAN